MWPFKKETKETVENRIKQVKCQYCRHYIDENDAKTVLVVNFSGASDLVVNFLGASDIARSYYHVLSGGELKYCKLCCPKYDKKVTCSNEIIYSKIVPASEVIVDENGNRINEKTNI